MNLLRALAPAAAALALAASAAVAAAPAPTYGIRVYELFQSGPRLVLEERTSRAFEPRNIRNVELGTLWPPADQPALRVLKQRNHLAFFGSYWREDGTPEAGKYVVDVAEDTAAAEPGVASVRVTLVPRPAAPPKQDTLAAVPVADSPSYVVRLYEVLHRGADVVLEERTTRSFGPAHLRGVSRGEVVPPSGQPGFGVWRSRDTLGYFGAADRVDGRSEKLTYPVTVQEVPGDAPMGATLVRFQLAAEGVEPGPRAPRRLLHPGRPVGAPAAATP